MHCHNGSGADEPAELTFMYELGNPNPSNSAEKIHVYMYMNIHCTNFRSTQLCGLHEYVSIHCEDD